MRNQSGVRNDGVKAAAPADLPHMPPGYRNYWLFSDLSDQLLQSSVITYSHLHLMSMVVLQLAPHKHLN